MGLTIISAIQHQIRRPDPIIQIALIAIACALFSLLLMWPGIATYDALVQYRQVLAGQYDDWHPPIMARLWALFVGAGWHGSGPMFLLQTMLFWGGLAAFALGVDRMRHGWRAFAVLALGLTPLMLDWTTVVIKDAQLLAALMAATGLVAAYRLAGRAMPRGAIMIVAILLLYAILLRANAIFAVAPLVCMWAGGVRQTRIWQRTLLCGAITVAAIGLSSPINHDLLGARRSHVEQTLRLYDMAGTGHFAGSNLLPGLPDAVWRRAERRGCYSAFFWDSYGDPKRCGFVSKLIFPESGPPVTSWQGWGAMIIAHPLEYARHRLNHWNSNMRFLVPFDLPNAAAPRGSEPNDLGLGHGQSRVTKGLWQAASWQAMTPLGWPAFWFATACGILWIGAATPRQPAREMALALALSSMGLMAGFLVVSVASDLRYHLWSMLAVMLAGLALSACQGVPRHRVRTAIIVVLIVALAGIVARLWLPLEYR